MPPPPLLPPPSAAHHVQVAVIGAGVIGLAIARALSQKGKEVLLMDRCGAVASETSARNSEVIHAGLYYPANTLKARFCVEGKHSLYDFCSQRGIAVRQCGKLVVSANERQRATVLPKLLQQAMANGVDDCRLLTAEDVRSMEPELQTCGGLLSPSTGVFDSHAYCMSLLADAEDAGTTLALQTDLEDASTHGRLEHERNPIHIKAEGMWIACDNVINCAGLHASNVASLFHSTNSNSDNGKRVVSEWQPPRQYFAKGNYFKLASSRMPFQRLVYPVPEQGGLGVHATIDHAGQSIKFGPDVEWMDANCRDPYRIDLTPSNAKVEAFRKSIQQYWQDLPSSDDVLVPDYAGIRPKLSHPSMAASATSLSQDFAIANDDQHGIRGLVHLFGIESPGLTSSLAIAEYVANMIVAKTAG